MSEKIKYERQILALKKKTGSAYSTFSVDDYLEKKEVQEDSPLELHAGFSRYLVTILESQEGLVTSVKANIPYKDVSLIKENYEAILITKSIKDILWNNPSSDNSGNEPEPKIFSIPEFKGMTPSEVLKKDKSNKQKLLEHIKILQDNITKYPKNKELIDAINNAINNIDGNENNNNNSNIYKEVYHPPIKYFRTEKDGLKECYEIKITYNEAMNYPFIVEISNFYAKVVTKANGTTTIELSNRKDVVSKKYIFSKEDFGFIVNRMVDNMKLFEETIYKEKRDIMDKNKFIPKSS